MDSIIKSKKEICIFNLSYDLKLYLSNITLPMIKLL